MITIAERPLLVIIMVENSVIVDLTEREVYLTSALMLLWRIVSIEGMISYLLSTNNDPIIRDTLMGLAMSEIDGSYNKMLMKYKNAAIAGIDGTKNL